MRRASIRVLMAYITFSLLYFTICAWLVRVHYPQNNVLGALNRLFFWVDGYMIYFTTIFATSVSGMFVARLKGLRGLFWAFLLVFVLAGLIVLYAAFFEV